MRNLKEPLGRHVVLSVAPVINTDRTEDKFKVFIDSFSISFKLSE